MASSILRSERDRFVGQYTPRVFLFTIWEKNRRFSRNEKLIFSVIENSGEYIGIRSQDNTSVSSVVSLEANDNDNNACTHFNRISDMYGTHKSSLIHYHFREMCTSLCVYIGLK